MTDLIATLAGTSPVSLHDELRALIAASRQRLTGVLNRLCWTVGQSLVSEVLGGVCAGSGARLLDQLGLQLSQEFGRSSEPRNLRRMVESAQVFADAAIVSSLSTQLPLLNAALIEARERLVLREGPGR